MTSVVGKGARFYGHGRYQRFLRRRFSARRKSLQKAGKKRALRKSLGKERRWMKQINHQLSHSNVSITKLRIAATAALTVGGKATETVAEVYAG